MSSQTSPLPRLIVQPEEHFSARQHIGARLRQEDYYAFSRISGAQGADSALLALVADGMGGHEAGSFASRLASNSFVDAFLHAEELAPVERLESAIFSANDAVLRGTEASRQHVGCMGTTLIAVLLTFEGLYWVSVGDSVAYLFRDGQLRRLNADHSFRPLIEEQIERGLITREQAREHPNRNTLRSAVTGYPIDLVDLPQSPLPLREDDLILCASDGLFSLSSAGVLSEIEALKNEPAHKIAEGLVEAVLGAHAEYQDNITVTAVKARPWVRDATIPSAGE